MKHKPAAPRTTPGSTIGAAVRRLRRLQDRTQADVATACGFTKSMLCKIEGGKTTPPIATVSRLAAVLGTTIAGLMEQSSDARAVFTPKAKADAGMTATEKGYAVFPFAPEFAGKHMQPFLFTATQGEVQEHSLSHPGEEFILVISGEIRFRVAETEYLMRPGDTLYFDAREPHGMQPVTATATYLDIFV